MKDSRNESRMDQDSKETLTKEEPKLEDEERLKTMVKNRTRMTKTQNRNLEKKKDSKPKLEDELEDELIDV